MQNLLFLYAILNFDLEFILLAEKKSICQFYLLEKRGTRDTTCKKKKNSRKLILISFDVSKNFKKIEDRKERKKVCEHFRELRYLLSSEQK